MRLNEPLKRSLAPSLMCGLQRPLAVAPERGTESFKRVEPKGGKNEIQHTKDG